MQPDPRLHALGCTIRQVWGAEGKSTFQSPQSLHADGTLRHPCCFLLLLLLPEVTASNTGASPGQSQRQMVGETLSVWKCLVLPGVGATAVFLAPKMALMVDDLPTLG